MPAGRAGFSVAASRVLDRDGQRAPEIGHPSSGELIAVAEADAWFAYYW